MGGGQLNLLDLIFDGVLSTNALSPDSVPFYYSTVRFLADLLPTLPEPMPNKLSRSAIIWPMKFTTIILLEYGIHRDWKEPTSHLGALLRPRPTPVLDHTRIP
jgi:hypothetical protein